MLHDIMVLSSIWSGFFDTAANRVWSGCTGVLSPGDWLAGFTVSERLCWIGMKQLLM